MAAIKGTILDARALRALVDDYGKGILSRRGQAVERALDILESEAVELAPVDIGNLEASTPTKVDVTPTRITATLAFNTFYAARVHELPEESRGPKTREKPGNEYGLAGPKYLERPLRGMKKKFGAIVAGFLKAGR